MIHYAWIIAFTGTLVTILAHGFGRMSYSVILPSMREGLSLSYTQVGLIGTGNFIGYLCLAIVGGFLAARFGVRRVVFISLVVIGISLILTGLTNSFLFAFLMRLITGLGNGSAYVPIMALPAAWFVARKRGLGYGDCLRWHRGRAFSFGSDSAGSHCSFRQRRLEICVVSDGYHGIRLVLCLLSISEE